MNSREKRLALIVGIILFIGTNVWFFDAYSRHRARFNSEVATRTRQLGLLRSLVAEEHFWQERHQWLQSAQPHLEGGDGSGVQLLDGVRDLAKKHAVLLESPEILPVASQPAYTAVAVQVEAKSTWRPLIDFLYDLQGPEQFVALENANLKIDSADPTQVRCRFKIARWYAPQ